MKKSFKFLTLLAFVIFAVSCDEDDDQNDAIVPDAGTISGGPFTFTAGDGVVDNVSGITVSDDAVGTNSSWIVTNEASEILGLPMTIEDLEGNDFDGAGVGVCFIWYIRYEDGLTGLEAGNGVDEIAGSFDISNSIQVNRIAQIVPNAGTISAGDDDSFTFFVDGKADNVSGITVSDDLVGAESSWIVTNESGDILGLPMTLEALEGNDFDGAGEGVCLIWYIRYEEGLTGLEVDMNTADLSGLFDVSNSITVNRLAGPVSGTISGGPFLFNVDGIVDNVSGITVSEDAMGSESNWIITNEAGGILGLPMTIDALEGVDFDGAGVGVCLIWYIRYEEGLTGLAVDMNLDDLSGVFDVSESITVTREVFGKLELSLTGLEDLGSEFVYEGWVIVDGAPVTTGTFTVGTDGSLSETTFPLPQGQLDAATMFVLSIEPAVDTDPAPADTKILSGAFSAKTATVTSGIVGDFSNAAGNFFLRTPTDEADGMNNGNDENGVWFGDPTATTLPSLDLPTLPAGWAYEGWVVGESGPLTTGTFTSFDVADDASPYSGDQAGPAIPGEDFFMNAPSGETFPLDIRGRTIVISVEPVPDNSAAPFSMKPLLGTAGNDTAPAVYDFGQNLGSLPSGSVSF